MTPKETEPRLPARVGGLLVGVWVSRGSPQESPAQTLLDFNINPTIEPVDPRAGSLRPNNYQGGRVTPFISR